MAPKQFFTLSPSPRKLEILRRDAKALDPVNYQGVAFIDENLPTERLVFTYRAESAVTQDAVDALVVGHDASEVTEAEYQQQVRRSGQDDFATLPGWATWTVQQAEDYIDTDVTDLASAKVVLKAMAKAIVALRNDRWPGLQG